jgi:hypothetical protein
VGTRLRGKSWGSLVNGGDLRRVTEDSLKDIRREAKEIAGGELNQKRPNALCRPAAIASQASVPDPGHHTHRISSGIAAEGPAMAI